jgi:hypothetical protein
MQASVSGCTDAGSSPLQVDVLVETVGTCDPGPPAGQDNFHSVQALLSGCCLHDWLAVALCMVLVMVGWCACLGWNVSASHTCFHHDDDLVCSTQ